MILLLVLKRERIEEHKKRAYLNELFLSSFWLTCWLLFELQYKESDVIPLTKLFSIAKSFENQLQNPEISKYNISRKNAF